MEVVHPPRVIIDDPNPTMWGKSVMEISGKTYGALGHFPTIVGLLRLKLGQRPAKSANVKVPNSNMWGKSVMEISAESEIPVFKEGQSIT